MIDRGPRQYQPPQQLIWDKQLHFLSHFSENLEIQPRIQRGISTVSGTSVPDLNSTERLREWFDRRQVKVSEGILSETLEILQSDEKEQKTSFSRD